MVSGDGWHHHGTCQNSLAVFAQRWPAEEMQITGVASITSDLFKHPTGGNAGTIHNVSRSLKPL